MPNIAFGSSAAMSVAEFGGGDERPDRLVDDHRVAVLERREAQVDRLLARDAADDAAEPRIVEAVVGDELAASPRGAPPGR